MLASHAIFVRDQLVAIIGSMIFIEIIQRRIFQPNCVKTITSIIEDPVKGTLYNHYIKAHL